MDLVKDDQGLYHAPRSCHRGCGRFDMTFDVKPELPVGRDGELQPEQPQKSGEPFHVKLITLTFDEHRGLCHGWALTQPTYNERGGTPEGPDADQKIAFLNRKNVWKLQMGQKSIDGPIGKFDDSVAAVSLGIRGFDFKYQAPGLGLVKFDWDGYLTLDGEVIPMADYPC